MRGVKKSDRSKQWRESARRSHPAKYRMVRHLIVCEGTCTEPLYFEAMRSCLSEENGRKLQVDVVGTGKHTLDLLDYAIEKARGATNSYAHVWIVYDKDDFKETEFDDVVSRCSKTRVGNTCFHAVWSNPCFEVWYLLHFGYTSSQMTSAECTKRFGQELRRAYGKDYKKSDACMWDLLADHRCKAQANADRLSEEHRGLGHEKPSECNPATRVGMVIREVAPFLNED